MSQRKHESKESNGLFFFERCSLITVMVCAYKLNNKRSLKSPSAFQSRISNEMQIYLVLICKIWTGSVSPRKCGLLTLFCVMVLPVCFVITHILLLPVFCYYCTCIFWYYLFYLCIVITRVLFVPVFC